MNKCDCLEQEHAAMCYLISLSRWRVKSTYLWICVHILTLEMLQNPQKHAMIYICTGNISQINGKNNIF